MSIKLCQAANSVVTPIDDARLYSWIANRTVGIASGCVVTSAGTNQLSITAGWGICQGHVFVVSAETISAAVAVSGTNLGRLLIHIDTSDSTTPVKFVTQAASTLPSLTQEAIDGSGSIYEIPLATYSVGTISISDLVDVATRLSGVLQAIGAATAAQGAKADTLAAGAVYSTTEVNTGKTWIDGKTIYRTVFQFTLPGFSGTAATNRYTLETGLAYDTIVSISGMFSQGASGFALYSVPIGADAANAAYSTFVFKSGSAAGRILVEFASGVASAPAFVILEYTK